MRGPSVAAIRGAIEGGARWLRADLGDTVRVERVTSPGATATVPAAQAQEIGKGLKHWSSRLGRRRAVAVTRRALLVAVAVALLVAIVILATGGDRPLWVLALLLLAPLGGLLSLTRAPSQAQTARALDRGLGLHERLGTALELRAAPAAPTGLGAMVVDEATLDLSQSLTDAKVVGRRATAEWAWLLALALALAIAIAVPRPGTGSSSAAAAAARHAHAAGAAGAPGANGKGRHAKATSGFRAPPIPTRSAPPVGLDGGAKGRSVNPYGGTYKGGHLQGKAQLSTHVGGQQAGLSLAGQGGSKGSHGGAGAGGAAKGGAGAASNGAASSRKLTAGAGGVPQSANGKPQSTASHRPSGTAGTQTGGGAPPGGESAGATKAAKGQGSGVVPVLGAKQGGLPLQAGFAPVHGQHGPTGGVSQQANGGGGKGRTAQATGTAEAGGSQRTALPPTFNSPSSQSDLQQNYFGGSNQLTFKAW